jgi:hypothetical protein
MSGFSLDIPIRFWAHVGDLTTCSFPTTQPRMTRFRSWAAIGATAALGLVAVALLEGRGFPAVLVALTAPSVALFVFRHMRRYIILKRAVSNMWVITHPLFLSGGFG